MASESSRELARLAASLEKTRRAESLATRTLDALIRTPTEPTGSLYLVAPCHDINAPTLDLMTQWRPELTLGHAVLLNDTCPDLHPLVKPIATASEADELIRTVTYAGTTLEFRVPSSDLPAPGSPWM